MGCQMSDFRKGSLFFALKLCFVKILVFICSHKQINPLNKTNEKITIIGINYLYNSCRLFTKRRRSYYNLNRFYSCECRYLRSCYAN